MQQDDGIKILASPPLKEFAVERYLPDSKLVAAAAQASGQRSGRALLQAALARYNELDQKLKRDLAKLSTEEKDALLWQMDGLAWVLSLPAAATQFIQSVEEAEEHSDGRP